jgi:hypothetical protein
MAEDIERGKWRRARPSGEGGGRGTRFHGSVVPRPAMGENQWMTTRASPATGTFKDQNRALQELARELDVLRGHNKSFKEDDPQRTLLLFAEAALVCLTMEHFVRSVLGSNAPAGATLHTLLEVAISKRLIKLPWKDQKDGVKRVCAVRNSLLHANYAQAAKEAGRTSVADYFKSVFASEIETMFKITDHIMKQIDPMTGKSILAATPQPATTKPTHAARGKRK